jgi:hypothetical protein
VTSFVTFRIEYYLGPSLCRRAGWYYVRTERGRGTPVMMTISGAGIAASRLPRDPSLRVAHPTGARPLRSPASQLGPWCFCSPVNLHHRWAACAASSLSSRCWISCRSIALAQPSTSLDSSPASEGVICPLATPSKRAAVAFTRSQGASSFGRSKTIGRSFREFASLL